jgi:hypothetical protein
MLAIKETAPMQQTATPTIIITEEYAVEIEKVARGYIAEVKDEFSPFNGVYALGSTASCALAALKAKINERR